MGVIVTFDVVEDLDVGIRGVLEATVLEHFAFESTDKRLGPGVVVGVRLGGHALEKAGVGESLPE